MTEPADSPFAPWADYFLRNPVRQQRIEAAVDWTAACDLPPRVARAMAHSFQRFELGESGEGTHLIGLAEATGDPDYAAAIRLLVAEEQRHSALFGRGLEHLGAPALTQHWSDGAFTVLRRSLGLRTEIALFLVAETVALGYFEALADHGPDAVLRGIGRRIVTDEREHIRFQTDRLHLDLHRLPRVRRLVVEAAWSVVAVGAATVLASGHAGALRACGARPLAIWRRSLRDFRSALRRVFAGGPACVLGPGVALPQRHASIVPD